MADYSSDSMDPLINECKLYGIDISVIMKTMPLTCSLIETFQLKTERLLFLKKLDIAHVLLGVKENEILKLRAENTTLQRRLEEREEEIQSLKEQQHSSEPDVEPDVFDWSTRVPPDVKVPGTDEIAALKEEPETENDAKSAAAILKIENLIDTDSSAASDAETVNLLSNPDCDKVSRQPTQSSSANSTKTGDTDGTGSQDAPPSNSKKEESLKKVARNSNDKKTTGNSKDTKTSGLKPKFFECDRDHCRSRMPSKAALKRHIRHFHSTKKSGSGIRCYKCTKFFASKDKLKEHNASAHSDVKYKCRHCSRAFYRRGNRKRHEKEHHKEKH